MKRNRIRTRSRSAAIAMSAALLIAACSNDDNNDAAAPSSSIATSTAETSTTSPSAASSTTAVGATSAVPSTSVEESTTTTALPTGALIDTAPKGDAFYLPPDPVPGQNGDVIWAADPIDVDGGQLYVVLYRSETINGTPIGVSGYIAVPDTVAPAGGRPVIAWAHGTRGLADECAPTRQDVPPSSDMPVLAELLQRGYVVAATDYEGLGTPGLHPYIIGGSEGRGVLDSARAAQRFKPAAGSDTVVLFGHSQGGHAIAFANELAATYAPELKVVGAVGSGAGVVGAQSGIVDYLMSSKLKGLMMITAAAQQAAYGPELAPPGRMLTEQGIAELANVEIGCYDAVIKYFAEIPKEELFRPDYKLGFTDGSVARDQAGNHPGTAPMLLVHGTEDKSIPASMIQPYIERVCGFGQAVQLKWYVGRPHRALYERDSGAADDVLAWIDARLAGEEAPNDCAAIPPLP